jgi:hypothetical protein
MKFETLRIMAQDYADRHKEPPPLPATIDTMAYAYQRICQGEDPWTALGDFYGYAKHIRPDLIKAPLTRPEQETEQTRHWGAFCAASVEYLCDLHHQPCPEWAYDPSYILDTPWWYTQRADDPTIREHTRRTTPPPFARRNIFAVIGSIKINTRCTNGFRKPSPKASQTYMKSSAMLVRKKSACTEPESIQDTAAG